MIDLEIFSCAGGLAEGFRRAGVVFDMAVDLARDHCDSYEANLGYRPVQMDVRDLLRMARLGWRTPVRMLVADPPCTPWSRAGKRKGTADARDMLRETAELIALLRPRVYLLGNIPGLEDSNNLPIVQEVIGGLARHGYCVVDFAVLNAADFGVPQHRYRPFWFGHLHGPCIRWPLPSHGDPSEIADTLPGVERLAPWVTCGEALAHLSKKELGRMVRLRKRLCNGKQHGSVTRKPARVVGTSNLSDGNVLVHDMHHPPSYIDEPANVVRAGDGGGANRALQLTPRQLPSDPNKPSKVILAKRRHNGGMVLRSELPQSARTVPADRPADTVQVREDRLGSGMVIEWPWARPSTTITTRNQQPPPGRNGRAKGAPGARKHPKGVLLSERAAKILQGFPDDWIFSGDTKKARWSQIGQAVPPQIGLVIALAIQDQLAATVGDEPPENFVPWSPPPARMDVVYGEQLTLGDAP